MEDIYEIAEPAYLSLFRTELRKRDCKAASHKCKNCGKQAQKRESKVEKAAFEEWNQCGMRRNHYERSGLHLRQRMNLHTYRMLQ